MSTRPIEPSDLHAYADDHLDPERRAEVDAWLAANPDEAKDVAQWRHHNDVLRRAYSPVLDEAIPGRLDPTRLARALPGLRAQERRVPVAAGIAFAAGVLAGALLLLVSQQSLAPRGGGTEVDQAAVLVTKALDAYRVFTPEVRHPVEVTGSEEAHLVQWLSKRLSYPIHLPNLGGLGYQLVGGRLLANAPGAAALFMFETPAGQRITLYCSRLAGSRDTAFRYREANGVNTFYWTDDQIGYAVSGPIAKDELLRLSRAVFEAMERHPDQPT